MMFLGAAEIDITPPVGTTMAGSTMPRVSIGIEDPLLCRAIVLESAGVRLALVTLDLVGFLREDCDLARSAAADATGIPAANLFINSSHTHSGPYPAECLSKDERPDPDYLARVRDAIRDAVALAASEMREVRVGTVATEVHGLGANRRLLRPDGDVINAWLATEDERATLPGAGPVDDELPAWVFFDGDRPCAALWNYNMHVNTRGGLRFSADYPGAVARNLHATLGDGFTVMFLSGACADVNRVAPYPTICHRLTEALLGLVETARPGDSDTLAATTREIVLPVRDREPFQADEVRAKWPSAFDVFEYEHEFLARRDLAEITSVISAIRIGDAAIATTPGEYFVQLGLDIKQRAPFPRTVVTELTNDAIGYIPTREAYEQGGYETFRGRWAQVSPGAGEQIADQLVEMLKQLRG